MSFTKNGTPFDKNEVPKITTSKAISNTPNIKQNPGGLQGENDPARVIEARRELLRDYGHEVAIQAADYAAIVANFISADDRPGLQYATAKFVAFARETAKTCRELIEGSAI
jgi:hypothetical protein